jgi:hypothetical protein
MIRPTLALVLSLLCAGAAEVIRERAKELDVRGQRQLAEQLRVLADALGAGTVALDDAALVVQIALAGPAPVSAPTRPVRSEAPPVSAAQVTSILDGETLPPPAATAPTAAAPPAPAATPAIAAPPIPVATTVLTASRVGEQKTLLVMIGAGADQQVQPGQRFLVKREEQQIAVISATQVKESMSICIAIAGTVAEGAEIRAGDHVISE